MEYLKILDLLPKGWDKDAHYLPFYLYLDEAIRIWLQKLKTSKYFKELIFKTLLFADDQFIISDTEDNFQKQSIYYIVYLKNIIRKLPQKRRRYLVSLGQIT